MSFFNTVEFYIIAGTLAAAGAALAALPPRRGKGVQHLIAGDLITAADGEAPRSLTPALDINVDSHGRVHIHRTGLEGIRDRGAVSLSINIDKFDILIEERLTPGGGEPTVESAMFTLDFLGSERYHVRYNSEPTGRFAAFTLNVSPGLHLFRELKN